MFKFWFYLTFTLILSAITGLIGGGVLIYGIIVILINYHNIVIEQQVGVSKFWFVWFIWVIFSIVFFIIMNKIIDIFIEKAEFYYDKRTF